jgi:hypothetical protein
MNSIATMHTEFGHAGRTGRLGSRQRCRASYAAGDRGPAAAVYWIDAAAEMVGAEGAMPPESSGRSSRSEREQQQRRNAAARRKLEARREQELLRRQLSEPWDEIGSA